MGKSKQAERKGKRHWQPVNAEAVKELVESDNFIHKGNCAEGLPIHSFRIPGESLEGRLRPCKSHDQADRAKTAELWFRNVAGKEIGVAIRLSTMLWQTVKDNELWGQWIRITYKGSVRGKFPNATKVYLVEVDKGSIAAKFERVKSGQYKNRKPRKPRSIRRPTAAA
jgi:hypothetical protein